MLLKSIGSILVLGSSAFLGILSTARLKKKMTILNGFITFLHMLETEICYSQENLSVILKKLANALGSPMAGFLETLDIHLSLTARLSWERTLSLYQNHFGLTEKEISVLKPFGSQLGSSDIPGQKKQITHLIEQLKPLLLEAQEAYAKNHKLYLSFGVLGGLGIVITLI